MSSIASLITNNSASGAQSTLPTQTLTQQDFLQLLVTQMTSQDPLNPQSDTDFAAQLAQFSSLQTSQTTQGNISQLQAAGLLGQTVSVTADGTTPVTGVVSGVAIQDGTPEIIVNGQAYALNQISLIEPTTTPTQTTQSTGSN
jgi:flagellar basal-body rod modification protein FlgD